MVRILVILGIEKNLNGSTVWGGQGALVLRCCAIQQGLATPFIGTYWDVIKAFIGKVELFAPDPLFQQQDIT